MWLKWTIKKLRNTKNICQVSNLNLYDKNAEKIPWRGTTVHVPSEVSYPNRGGPDRLIDDNTASKFSVLNFSIFVDTGLDIIFEMPNSVDIKYYSYDTANDFVNSDPVSWELYSSTDNTNWALLSEVINANITTERQAETKAWIISSDNTIKYLIKDNNTLYTVENNELKVLDETALTANTFIKYGSDSPPTYDILNAFTNPKVYCWKDSNTPVRLKATVKGTPLPQTVITNDINISHESITGVEKITATYTGNPLVACSFDNGITWKLYNGTAWAVLSETDTGMTMKTLLAITSENWSSVLSGLKSFKLRFTLSSIEDTVTNIIINFTN